MKDIIELAREANKYADTHADSTDCDWPLVRDERFAALVRAAALEEAAKLVEPSEEHRRDASRGYLGGTEGVELLAGMIADAIRALKEKT